MISPCKKHVIQLKLKPHPEGGYFREVHRSGETVTTTKGKRSAITHIYYLLPKGEISRLHRVTSDEIWHYIAGASLNLIEVSANFKEKTIHKLGPMSPKCTPFVIIPRNHWQGARSSGDFTLVSCTVAPGFDFADFSFPTDQQRNKLLKLIPSIKTYL